MSGQIFGGVFYLALVVVVARYLGFEHVAWTIGIGALVGGLLGGLGSLCGYARERLLARWALRRDGRRWGKIRLELVNQRVDDCRFADCEPCLNEPVHARRVR